ncbi:MAG: hypothetical protein AB7G21_11410 [Dehalococcoidia bacterium]
MTLRPPLLIAAVAAAGLALTACTGGTEATPTAPAPTTAASASTAAPTSTPAASAPTAAASATSAATSAATTPAAGASGATAVAKVSANTGSRAEIQAALQAAGVPNAANWTREVLEYRPYPADDANLTKLRQNLAKYNPGPGVVDAIVSALKP